MAHDESATDQPLSSVLSGKIPVHQIKSFHEVSAGDFYSNVFF